jgi:competence protein ComEC
VAARHVIFQAGAWNRHGHPDAAVLARWRGIGATLWRTDTQGGIHARSRADGLMLSSVLASSRRYWHERRPSADETSREAGSRGARPLQ